MSIDHEALSKILGSTFSVDHKEYPLPRHKKVSEASMFKEYSSIENSYRDKEIEQVRSHGFDKVEWVATEKVHGCLRSTTKISMADGTKMSIGDIVRNNIDEKVLGVDEDGNVVETKILNWFDNGISSNWKKVSYSIIGMERGGSYGTIYCTGNHKFKVGDEYIEASDLSIGDMIYRKRSDIVIPFFIKQVMIGKMLGDGSYSNRSITFGHNENHEEYVDYTLKCLGKLSGNRQKDGISGYGTTMCRGRSISSYTIEDIFSKWISQDGKKIVPMDVELSPIALAFWYMDDGNLCYGEDQNYCVSIATNGFDELSVSNLVHALQNLGISAKEKDYGDGWRIKIDGDNSDKLFCLIYPYVCKCMRYKLPTSYQIECNQIIPDVSYKQIIMEQEIISVEDLDNKYIRYDIETETHNFFANNVLVHNSNFSLWPIDGQVIPGKRSSFTDGAFYGCQAIVEELTPKILSLGLTVYGEIFGDGIQKGVNYGKKRFAAFDIWDGENFLHYDRFVELCDKHGIERCYEIAGGKFDDLLAIDPSFPTNMSVVEGCVDIAEGFVMKPVNAVRFGNGSRVILKKKSPGFSEQAKGPRVKVDIILTESQQELLNKAASYVTMAKLDCVLSKMDDPKFPEALGAMLQDIYVELGKDDIDLSTWKSINKQISGLIAPLVRERLFGVKA